MVLAGVLAGLDTSVIRVPVERVLGVLGVEFDATYVYAASLPTTDAGDGNDGGDENEEVEGNDGGDGGEAEFGEGSVVTQSVAGVRVSVERAGNVEGIPPIAMGDVEPSDFVAVATATSEGSSTIDGSSTSERATWGEGDVLGWAFLRVDSPVTVDECVRTLRFDGAYTWGLYVEPSVRGRGIGTALVRAATHVAARDRYETAFVLVAAANERSRRIFERAGYRLVDETSRVSVRGWQPPIRAVLGSRTYANWRD